jgi:inorganic triphosphatase YgiF
MSQEIELKLAVAPRHLAALERAPMLRSAGSQRTRKRLYTVYYDSPEGALWRQGVALRLRRDGRRWLQTVKWGGDVAGGLHTRGELEHEVPGPLADFSVITEPALASVFASAELRAQLKPAFVTEFERLSVLVAPAADISIEVCIDRGSVKSGNRVEKLSELELELKSGPPWRLYETALALMGATPFTVELRSKAARGYALLGAGPERPVKGVPAELRTDMTVHEAFRAVVLACLGQFQANQHGMLTGGDHEFLHQMRVALRRLRSAFALFGPVLPPAKVTAPLAELRRLGRALGAARDWDVFETERLPGVARHFKDHRALAALAREVDATRRSRGAAARRAVSGVRCQRFQLQLAAGLLAGDWLAAAEGEARDALEGPVLPFAQRMLEDRLQKARKRAKKLGERTDPELHQLRIAVKKVRYAAEFFAPLFDVAPVKAFRDAAARLQDTLGIVNDASVVAPLLKEAGLDRGLLREAGALVAGWSGAEAQREKQNLPVLWRGFLRTSGYWHGKT